MLSINGLILVKLNNYHENRDTHKRSKTRKKITLQELSKKSGISKSHINYIEKQLKQPTLIVMIQISKALNIDLKKLYKVYW